MSDRKQIELKSAKKKEKSIEYDIDQEEVRNPRIPKAPRDKG